MFQIDFSNEVVGLAAFVIDGEDYSEDGEHAIVPAAILKKQISPVFLTILILNCVNHNLMTQ